MKTAEQMTADVLARRDEYLKKRAVRRKQAARYAAASLLVCAAAFAAAGLFRSGLLDDAPPVSLNDVIQSDRTDASESASSHGNDYALSENGTGARETTVPRAVDHTGTTTAIALSGKTVYVFPSVTEPASAAPREEPGTAAQPTEPTTHRQPPETTTPQTPVSTTDPFGKILPCPTRPQPTTDNGNACAEAPTALPTDEPETKNPASTQPEETYYNIFYVIYNGALYLAENVLPVSIPAEARTLEQKDALLYDEALLDAALAELLSPDSSAVAGSAPSQPDEGPYALLGRPDASEESEPVSMRITLLALPGASAAARIGVTSEGFDGKMFVLEYYGILEELIQEETP